jgi:nucleotide-binding universal stress UspA family protein
MTTILCPTRGGKESHPNQDYAINLAKVRNADLLFLYVSNIQLISRSGPPIVVDIEEELDELGDFLLSMAQERAENAGIPAKVAVHRGIFSKVLQEVIVENKIDTVVLGSAPEETGIVSYERLQELSEELSEELGVEFIVVQGGKVVFHTEAKM